MVRQVNWRPNIQMQKTGAADEFYALKSCPLLIWSVRRTSEDNKSKGGRFLQTYYLD